MVNCTIALYAPPTTTPSPPPPMPPPPPPHPHTHTYTHTPWGDVGEFQRVGRVPCCFQPQTGLGHIRLWGQEEEEDEEEEAMRARGGYGRIAHTMTYMCVWFTVKKARSSTAGGGPVFHAAPNPANSIQ